MKNIFSTRTGIIIVGAVIGIGAALLQYFGNPPNMGICVACFERDIAGALGLHRADVVQYLRPEIMGFVLGAFVAAFLAGEYKPRGGSAPLIRFFLGIFAMLGRSGISGLSVARTFKTGGRRRQRDFGTARPHCRHFYRCAIP